MDKEYMKDLLRRMRIPEECIEKYVGLEPRRINTIGDKIIKGETPKILRPYKKVA